MILEVALDPVVVEQSVVNINKDNKGMRGRHSELRNAQACVLNQIPRQHVDVNRSTRIGFPSMAQAHIHTLGLVHYRSLLRDTNLQENRHFQLSFAKLREKSSVAFAFRIRTEYGASSRSTLRTATPCGAAAERIRRGVSSLKGVPSMVAQIRRRMSRT
jgi:hypothetical protein